MFYLFKNVWIHLQTLKVTYIEPNTEQLNVDHKNICSVQESNLQHAAQQSNAQPLQGAIKNNSYYTQWLHKFAKHTR